MTFWKNHQGFSLVEIMVAMVIMGVVVGAVYSTFINTQRHAYTQEEVVEVQQNLRAGLDFMVKDIRMAEFLTTSDHTALVNAPAQMLVDSNGDGDFDDTDERPLLSLVSATSMHGYARINDATVNGTNLELDVAVNTMQQFADGDSARVFRAVSLTPVTDIYPVDGTPSGDQVTLDISGGGYSAGDIQSGDLLVRMPGGAANGDFPLQIDYRLVDAASGDPNMNELQRRVLDMDGNVIEEFQLIASNISGITLAYLDDAGAVTSDLNKIVAVQITIVGQTDATKTGRSNFSGVKDRSLSTTVKIHNGVML
jgi:prepilin-type N-terminal cleavage/methylation domain-containing protein